MRWLRIEREQWQTSQGELSPETEYTVDSMAMFLSGPNNRGITREDLMRAAESAGVETPKAKVGLLNANWICVDDLGKVLPHLGLSADDFRQGALVAIDEKFRDGDGSGSG